jgi:hypothetical protein
MVENIHVSFDGQVAAALSLASPTGGTPRRGSRMRHEAGRAASLDWEFTMAKSKN